MTRRILPTASKATVGSTVLSSGEIVVTPDGLLIGDGTAAGGQKLEWYEAVAGETGVINHAYVPGDVRRYGVFPDGVTNWENDHSAKAVAIFANSCLPGLTVYWPPGEYATSINVGVPYSGSKMHFDSAIFFGIVHVLAITDVKWTGDVASYDRLGVSTGSKRIELPAMVRMLHDPAKNTSGFGNRGVHIQGSTDVTFGTILVANTGKTGLTAPADQSNWAAVAIQGIDPTAGIENGYRITGQRIVVLNAQGHGVYINAIDVNIGAVIVEGYGNQSIDFNASAFLSDTDSEAQSEVGAGVWINRSTGRIGSLRIRQSNASAANDVYALLLDETGRSGTTPLGEMFNIEDAEIEVGGTNNRGIVMGAVTSPSARCNVRIGHLKMRQRIVSAAYQAMATGYAMLNVLASSTSTDSRYRLAIGKLSVTDADTAIQVRMVSGTGTRVTADLEIQDWAVHRMGAGRLFVADSSAQANVISYDIGRIRGNYDGGTQASPMIQVTDVRRAHIRSCEIEMASVVSTPTFKATRITDGTFGGVIASLNGNTAVDLDTSTRLSLQQLRIEGNAGAGTGVIFTGTHIDLRMAGVNVTTCAKGFDNGTGMAFTRGSAINVVGASNTVDTDLTVTDFPAARQLGCSGFAV